MVENNEKYYINIKTIQATIFKQVIDALKDILMDVNLEIDETGVKIIAMDNTHVVLIHLKLEADKFEEYIKFIANRRFQRIGLPHQYPGATNPFEWMSEMMDLNKEKNFFETRVIEYQTGGALNWE